MTDLPATVPQSDAASLMAVISRAASDPTVDVDKLERLMGMYERITANQAKSAYDAAFAEMQPKLPIIDRRGAIVIRDKNDDKIIKQSTPYALFEDISEAITPILAEHGFGLSFRVGLAMDGKINTTAILSHKLGHREETTLTLPHDSTGSKNAVQAVGSSLSYGKRYTMCALLNITTRGEDDDGAGADKNLSAEQTATLTKLLLDCGMPPEKFLTWAKVTDIAEIKAESFSKAVNAVNAWAANKKAAAK